MKNQIIKNKKGIELSLETIVIFIILIIVLVVMIYFFTHNYTSNNNQIHNISTIIINNYS
jgi:uncharacterized protein (UPF0333 family)